MTGSAKCWNPPLSLLCASAEGSLHFQHCICVCVLLWVEAWLSLLCCCTASYQNGHTDLLPNHRGLSCFKIWKIAPSCLSIFFRVQISSLEYVWGEFWKACRSEAGWIPHTASAKREFAPQGGKFSAHIQTCFLERLMATWGTKESSTLWKLLFVNIL